MKVEATSLTPETWMSAHLSDADYDFLCRLIYDRSRIHLGPDKRVLVSSRLSKRLRQLKLSGYGEYCALLKSPAGADELQVMIDRISTNLYNSRVGVTAPQIRHQVAGPRRDADV